MFILMRTAVGHEIWLKEEASLRAPELKPTVQGTGWVSFKFQDDEPFTREDLESLKGTWGLNTWWSVHEIAVFLGKSLESGAERLAELGIKNARPRAWGALEGVSETRGPLTFKDAGFWEWIQIPFGKECWSGLKYASPQDRLSQEATLPAWAPSRAYLKLSELAPLFEVPLFKAGETVVECGAAPGGMTAYLLSQGVSVDAIDTGELDFEKLKSASQVGAKNFGGEPKVFYVKRGVASMTAEKNEGKYDGLVWDLNVPPPNTCREIDRLIDILGSRLRVIVGTLKFNFEDDSLKVDRFRESLAKVCQRHGFEGPEFLGHVPSARREILFVLRRSVAASPKRTVIRPKGSV